MLVTTNQWKLVCIVLTQSPKPWTAHGGYEVSPVGALTLREETTFDQMPQYYLPSKGNDFYYLHNYETNLDVTFNLKIYHNEGHLLSDTVSIFKKVIDGQVSSDRYNGLPFAFGIFDGGTYYYGRVVIYNSNGKIYERLFDSIKIHRTFVSANNKFYMLEKKTGLLENSYYLIPMDSKEFELIK